jgi:hypothetical protein
MRSLANVKAVGPTFAHVESVEDADDTAGKAGKAENAGSDVEVVD